MIITTALQYFAALLAINALVFLIYKKYPNKFFKWFPSVMMVFVVVVLLNTFGVWSFNNPVIADARNGYLKYVIPFMIFCISVQSDVKKMAKVGPKMLSVFIFSSISICIGMVVAFKLFAVPLGLTHAPESFGAWTGSFVGGVENLYAVSDAVKLSADEQANVLLLINIVFRPWMTLLIVMAPLAVKFNKWSKADTSAIDRIAARIDEGEVKSEVPTVLDVFMIAGIGYAVVAIGFWGGDMLFAQIPGVPSEVWRYLIVTITGVLLGTFTKLGQTNGLGLVGSALATLTLAVSCSNTDLKTFMNAGTFLLCGITVLGIHALIMILLAKVMKVDLCTLGIASIANIGGVSSAPVVAANYGKSYQTVGVLMAALGSMIGTFVGLGVCSLLRVLA